MTKIFQDAGDYKTITKFISDEKRKAIEKRLGEKLTPGESKDWVYYEITGSQGEMLGYIVADAEKGEYGVIEIVMGITPDGRIKGLYIQRSQEKDKQFKSKEFLDPFTGKALEDVEKEKRTEEYVASKAVVFGVRKMFLFYEELTQ